MAAPKTIITTMNRNILNHAKGFGFPHRRHHCHKALHDPQV
jgi:hypothetical protein